MLYIFHVDTGTMMTFEMNLALESVGQLKDVIEKTRKIPVEKQVLLVSGGECLDPSAKVCSYSAGTDTNPIFLFSKCTLENAKPPSPSIDYGSDSDMKDLVDNSLMMPAKYNTIVKRAQIAQQFCELAREHTLVCESLVHDQHLQQQGWAAAVANLEDITAAFRSKSEMFQQNYRQYLETREENLKMLQNFSNDLQILAKIPILDPLISNALSFSTAENKKKYEEGEASKDKERGEESESKSSKEMEAMTLLMWISTADNHSSLEQVAEQAQRGLEQFDEKVLDALTREVDTTLETANKNEMKEIKGLEERLFGLEQLMVETKKIVQEQTDLAQALLQNQTRASSLNDPSVLPDLCASHRKQLLVMLHNQHMLRDIRRRCSKAKEELSINLYHRLGWVMYVENLILDVSNKLMIYHENLKRLRKYLEITRQVQRTPEMYVAAVGEVVRRRTFSQAFLTWASDLSCRLLAVYNEEYEKRKDFQSQFEGHFLQSLFPGFEDNPPPFATQAPTPFDVGLPQLTVKDMEQLKVHLPELSMSLSVTNLSSIAQMFLAKSSSEAKPSSVKENDPVEDQLVVAVSEAGLGSRLDKTLLQPTDPEGERKKLALNKDDRDFESETDTEEFEKVCQSPVEVKTSIEPKLEENSGSDGNVVQTLRNHLTEAGKLANATAIYLKTELIEMKSQSLTDKEAILALVKDIQIHISHLTQRHSAEVEALQKKLQEVIKSRDSEAEALKKILKGKEELLCALAEDMDRVKNALEETKSANVELSHGLGESELLCQELKTEIKNMAEEKAKALQDCTEQLRAKVSEYEDQLKMAKEERDKVVAEEREKLIEDYSVKMEEMKSALIRTELVSEMERERATAELQQKFSTELNEKLEQLRRNVTEEAEADKLRAVKEATEKLTIELKTEMENLRSRFRLMSATGMEKSPSDSSLEKIERSDMIELANHEAIVAELREIAEVEKERAIEEAVAAEREKSKAKLEGELKLGKARMEEEKQIWLKEAVNRAVAEKNNKIEALVRQQEHLLSECQRHRETITLLTAADHVRSTSCPGGGAVDPLVEKLQVLGKEKVALGSELDRRKPRRTAEIKHVDDMSASVAVVPATEVPCRDAATSPEPSARGESSREKLSKMAGQGKISITSCSIGDAVLVVWNVEHANYTILQETSTLYFLHSDCLDNLGLRPSSDGSPRRLYCTAEVIEKEYCHAKKSENRYRVPKGTKFYRVKVRPIAYVKEPMSRSCHHSHSHSHSRGGEMSTSQQPAELSSSQTRQSLDSSLASSQLSQSVGGWCGGGGGGGGAGARARARAEEEEEEAEAEAEAEAGVEKKKEAEEECNSG